jgi:hypothetical protein
LRKPPPVDVDQFIARGATETRPVPVPVRPADELVTRADGRILRELTVYLPTEIARKLSLACMEKDRDVSNVLAEIVDEYLTQAPRAEQTPASIGNALDLAQRMLLSKVQTLWSRRPRFV